MNEDPQCLIQRVLKAQLEKPSKNDLILSVEKTLDELDIHLTHEDLMNTSFESLHKFVKQQVEEQALAYLNMMKLKHSKVLHIRHESLKIQEYLMPENVKSIEMSKFLLNARCRMLEVGANFRQNV